MKKIFSTVESLIAIRYWVLWKERNNRRFNFEAKILSETTKSIILLFQQWTSIKGGKACSTVVARLGYLTKGRELVVSSEDNILAEGGELSNENR